MYYALIADTIEEEMITLGIYTTKEKAEESKRRAEKDEMYTNIRIITN